MDDHLRTLAEELGMTAPEGAESKRLLEVARVVAHGTERRNAPLATFLAGRYVETCVSQGMSATDALAKFAAVVERVIPASEA